MEDLHKHGHWTVAASSQQLVNLMRAVVNRFIKSVPTQTHPRNEFGVSYRETIHSTNQGYPIVTRRKGDTQRRRKG